MMKILRVFLLMSLFLLSTSLFAAEVIITEENFEGGASGWSDNSTDNSYPATFTEFLGRFDNGTAEPVSKTFPINAGSTTIKIAFDFYEIDSWDFELFRVYVNGDLISDDDFKHNRDEGPIHGLPKILPGDVDGNQDMGYVNWPDQGFHYEFEMDMSANSLTLGFETTIDSSLADESYGIDNLVISQEVPDSVPFSFITWALMILALAALSAFVLKRRFLAV